MVHFLRDGARLDVPGISADGQSTEIPGLSDAPEPVTVHDTGQGV